MVLGPGKTWREGFGKAGGSCLDAEAKSEPVVLRAGRSPVRIGTNRRLPTRPGHCDEAESCGTSRSLGRTCCVWIGSMEVPWRYLFSHAAHPVIIHGSSRLISAEFPGFAAQKLKKRLAGNVIAMFGQAFAGNINGDPLRGGNLGLLSLPAKYWRKRLSRRRQRAKPFRLRNSDHFSALGDSSASTPLKGRVFASSRGRGRASRKTYGRDVFNDEQLWDMQDDVETAKSQKESKAADDVQPMEGKAWWMMDTVLCLRDLLSKIETHDERPLRFDAHLLRVGDHWSLLAATHELFAEYQLTLDKAAPPSTT